MVSLSLCMIVRNEEASLGACLGSVRQYVDEMVIVDTGSTDGTMRVAREFGARVIAHPWEDDFATARNHSLSEARGRWILVLDADERLLPPGGDALRELLGAPQDIVAYLLQLRMPTSSSLQNGIVRLEGLPRLFRNGVGARYVGAVHECVLPSLAGKGRIAHADVTIEHDGYQCTPDMIRAKALRNLRILLRGLESDPGDALAWIQVGDCHACLQDTERAIEAYRAGLDLVDMPIPGRRQSASPSTVATTWQQLGAALLTRGEVAEAMAALNRALLLWPALASARVFLGQAHARRGDWERAIQCYRASIDVANQPAPPDQPIHLVPWLAWYLKGAAEAKLGRIQDAEQSLIEALRLRPDYGDAHQLLELVRRLGHETRTAPVAG